MKRFSEILFLCYHTLIAATFTDDIETALLKTFGEPAAHIHYLPRSFGEPVARIDTTGSDMNPATISKKRTREERDSAAEEEEIQVEKNILAKFDIDIRAADDLNPTADNIADINPTLFRSEGSKTREGENEIAHDNSMNRVNPEIVFPTLTPTSLYTYEFKADKSKKKDWEISGGVQVPVEQSRTIENFRSTSIVIVSKPVSCIPHLALYEGDSAIEFPNWKKYERYELPSSSSSKRFHISFVFAKSEHLMMLKSNVNDAKTTIIQQTPSNSEVRLILPNQYCTYVIESVLRHEETSRNTRGHAKVPIASHNR